MKIYPTKHKKIKFLCPETNEFQNIVLKLLRLETEKRTTQIFALLECMVTPYIRRYKPE